MSYDHHINISATGYIEMMFFSFFVFYCISIFLFCAVPLFLAEMCYFDWKKKKNMVINGKNKTDILFNFYKDFFDGCKNIALSFGLLIICSPIYIKKVTGSVLFTLVVINIIIFMLPFIVWGRKISVALDVNNSVITAFFGLLSIGILLVFFLLHPEIRKGVFPDSLSYISDNVIYFVISSCKLWGYQCLK